MSDGNRVPLTVAIAVAASLVSGISAYYVSQSRVQAQIAQVREDYVKKDELREQVQKPLEDVKKDVSSIKTEQAVQGQMLQRIEKALERQEGRKPPP